MGRIFFAESCLCVEGSIEEASSFFEEGIAVNLDGEVAAIEAIMSDEFDMSFATGVELKVVVGDSSIFDEDSLSKGFWRGVLLGE